MPRAVTARIKNQTECHDQAVSSRRRTPPARPKTSRQLPKLMPIATESARFIDMSPWS